VKNKDTNSENNAMAKQKIPFPFVLEYLDSMNPVTRPMFGCHSIYIGKKIVLILRQRKDHILDNGVWLATTPEHHASLKKIFPSMRSITYLGGGETNWQVLPLGADDFEEYVATACNLILRFDPRIGKVPKSKKGRN
jgi:hypothetical protein